MSAKNIFRERDISMFTNVSKAENFFMITNEIPGWGECLHKMGDAHKRDNDLYYTIKLFALPFMKYFLVKNPYKYNDYILYSGMKFGGFCRPVGCGRFVDGTNYVKVDFYDLKLAFYLRFGTEDFRYSNRAA